MQIEQEHLLAALLEQENGLIPQLMKKMEVDPAALQRELKTGLTKCRRVTGPAVSREKFMCPATWTALFPKPNSRPTDEGRVCQRGAHFPVSA